jgi:branched-chain amino acid transport system substrate-binding protein
MKKCMGIILCGMLLLCAGFPSEAAETVKIGNIAPLTGPIATYGQSHANGVALAIEQANAAGGVNGKKIEYIKEDDQGDPVVGASAALKLIEQDKVLAIVGPVPSTVGMATASIMETAKVPAVMTGTSPAITPGKHYVTRSCWTDDFQGVVMARFCMDNLKAKTAAVLYDLGNDYAASVAEIFAKTFEEAGGEIVTMETHPTGAVDFKAQLSIIKSKKPDVFFFSDFYNDASLIGQQAKEMGIESIFVGADAWDSPDLNLAALEGAYYCSHFSQEDPRPETRAFVESYKEKYGSIPDLLAIMGYDAALMVIDGLRRAVTLDSPAIADAIAQTKGLKGAQGDITLNENGDPTTLPAAILKIEGGKISYVTSFQPISK